MMVFSEWGNLRNGEEAHSAEHVGFCVIPNPLRIKPVFGPQGAQACTKGFAQQELAEI